MTAAGTRARVRAEITREITDVARRHLASDGAAALSLRAVARELGMASSAVYRYFPSRDELLTTLIMDGYDALGAAAEQAEAPLPRSDLAGRWRATCAAVRAWALAHPHEYALLYGSPVPGYAAPPATVGPATRVAGVLSRLLADGVASGAIDPDTEPTVTAPGPGRGGGAPAAAGRRDGDRGDPAGGDATLTPDLAERMGLPPSRPGSSLAARAIMAWTGVFGLISFELFGHTNNVVADHDRYFAESVDRLGALLGLATTACG